MAYSKTEQLIFEMAKPIAENMGCYVYDVEYIKEGKASVLRVFVDKTKDRISIDECEAISRELSQDLDQKDPIKENYMLEVSSPGIERKLKAPWHFEMYAGKTVDVGLYQAINGEKLITGTLKGLSDDMILLTIDGEEMSIMQSETTFVKLHFDF